MSHSNEEVLRDLYAVFAKGDIEGFLDGCTDDVTFTVPGHAAVSGSYTKATFTDLISVVMGRSGGTFQEDLVDVFANDEHGAIVLIHRFDRDGTPRTYQTTHVVTFDGEKLATWAELPGSLAEFETAWGPK
jgi:ketosteroid isomerase-like protein